MGHADFKSSLYRLVTDLIKCDSILAVDELDFLDGFCAAYGIRTEDKIRGYQTTMAEAFSFLSGLGRHEKGKLLSRMKESTQSDGHGYSLSESLFIQAAMNVFSDRGASVISMPSTHLPITEGQILYVENSDNGNANAVLGRDDQFEEIQNTVRMGGFELIYIPRIARHYAGYGKVQDLERLITLVSPAHTKEQMANTISILRHMSTRYFYQNILRAKLGMPLDIRKPAWLLRLPDDVVNGTDHANFLCLDAGRDVKAQLRELVTQVASRTHEFTITVNSRTDRDTDFLYGGFYKAILDVMAIKEVDRWRLRIREYGSGVDAFKDTESGIRSVISICKDGEEHALPLSGRDAAFYVHLLCASASEDGGIDFSDLSRERNTMLRYEQIYRRLSRRSIGGDTSFQRCPDVTAPQTRIPMKSRLLAAIRQSRLTEQSLYMPEESVKGKFHIPVEPGKVSVVSPSGECLLEDSALYREFTNCKD